MLFYLIFIGFTFFGWLRLDQNSEKPNTRRQLYSLYSKSGSGLGKKVTFIYQLILIFYTGYLKAMSESRNYYFV